MKLTKDDDVFNFINTNGRRKDLLNALQIYAQELEGLHISSVKPWKAWPQSLSELQYYEKVLARSSDVFKKHGPYDIFKKTFDSDSDFRKRFMEMDESLKSETKYKLVLKKLDEGVEARARHYSSNLVKLGLAEEKKRTLTENGKILLDPDSLVRDELEKMLPISNTNLLILRQALKVRIYDNSGKNYYSPVKLILYMLLRYTKGPNVTAALRFVQNLSPYRISNVDRLLDNFFANNNSSKFNQLKSDKELPERVISSKPFTETEFFYLFDNRKSSKNVEIYYDFYKKLMSYLENKCDSTFQDLRKLFLKEKNSNILKKAFGYGKAIFKFPKKWNEFEKNNVNNPLLQSDNYNLTFYKRFVESKLNDRVKEDADTTKRLIEATGIFYSTSSNILSLVAKPLFENKEILDSLKNDIFHENVTGNDMFESYENVNGEFCRSTSLMEILKLSKQAVLKQILNVKKKYGVSVNTSLEEVLKEKRDADFKQTVHTKFPKQVVFDILALFKNRDNDKKIKKAVTEDADVPTIFEYIVGLAWYYLSDDKSYNLIDSFNLSLNANFLPIGHAPGGEGDIIINYKDYILMIEVTLMNKQAQKRGEWEPVLRHSVNLEIESSKQTTTLFIADELDSNTINIWRAVSSVPLESSQKSGVFTNKGVQIMPLEIKDVLSFEQSDSFSSDNLIKQITTSYSSLRNAHFDMNWRENIINSSLI